MYTVSVTLDEVRFVHTACPHASVGAELLLSVVCCQAYDESSCRYFCSRLQQGTMQSAAGTELCLHLVCY